MKSNIEQVAFSPITVRIVLESLEEADQLRYLLAKANDERFQELGKALEQRITPIVAHK